VSHAARRLDGDWYDGAVPSNVVLDEGAYLETAFSFSRYRSQRGVGVHLGTGAAAYQGTMFDVGPAGEVTLGAFSFNTGAWFICDDHIEVGAYTMISWNVVIMDSYRAAFDPIRRRQELQCAAARPTRRVHDDVPAAAVRIGSNVWIGFDVCILPGVTIGDGSIIGARSVVVSDIPPYCVAGGNPAGVIRFLTDSEREDVSC